MSTLDTHGVHVLVPEVEYRAYPAINYSHLKHGARSAAHLKASIDGLLKPPGAASVNLGTCVHTLILQPDRFDEIMAVEPDGIDRRTKEGKKAGAEFDALSVGKVVVDTTQLAVAKRMAERVRGLKAARELLDRRGSSEVTLRWATGGVECKARIDHLADGDPPTLIDVKTTDDASPGEFEKSIFDLGYHLQAAWYSVGYAALHNGVLPHYRIIAVENKPPYEPVVYELEPATFEIGMQLMGEIVAMYANCRETGVWPGYGDDVKPIGIPMWAKIRYREGAR